LNSPAGPLSCPACQAENEAEAATCSACGASLLAPTAVIVSVDLSEGSVFDGRYRILGFLGRGGMGMVYRAHDTTLDETVAIKVLRPDFAQDPAMAARFRTEIKLARKVRHRNVCAIHDYGEERGLLYISMELVEGVDLKRVLKERGALPVEEAFDLAIQIAEGLQAVHEAGIIHRDLKTPNIMVDPRRVARLMDFGIAKRQEGGGASTATGQVLGTPEYMSPEQAQGQRVDFRSDVYALGVVIYEIFTGDVPFRGATPISTILKHLHDPPPIDTAKVPDPLRPVLRRALAKDPAMRYPSASALADALREARPLCRQDEVPTEMLVAPTLAHPGLAAPKRRYLWAAVGGAALLAVALFARQGSVEPPLTATAVAPSPSATALSPSPSPEAAPSVDANAEVTPLASADSVAPRRSSPEPATSRVSLTPSAPPVVSRPSPVVAIIPSPSQAPIQPPTPTPMPTPTATPSPVLASTPPAMPGQLQVAVRPWAEVVVDGRVMGTTPLDKITLEPGSHDVLLRHPAYQELRRNVTVISGQMVRLIVDLAKEGSPKR